jgi:RimJ/RimL family protein N-acetyltransferase
MSQFPLIPRFTSETTALCPYNDETPQLFNRWFSDNELISRMGDWEFYPVPYSDHTAADYAKRTRKTTWLICAVESDKLVPIGYTGIYVKARHRIGIFRIAIPEASYRRFGHGYRATMMFIEWAFTQLDLFALHLSVTGSNAPAVGLYKKCGFRECGRYTDSRYEPDGRHDEVHMELLRTDWETSRTPNQ